MLSLHITPILICTAGQVASQLPSLSTLIPSLNAKHFSLSQNFGQQTINQIPETMCAELFEFVLDQFPGARVFYGESWQRQCKQRGFNFRRMPLRRSHFPEPWTLASSA